MIPVSDSVELKNYSDPRAQSQLFYWSYTTSGKKMLLNPDSGMKNG
jgi:hypothetical protein